jgi:hypothetical protein
VTQSSPDGGRSASGRTRARKLKGYKVSHYKCNVRDLESKLFEVFDVDKASGDGEFSELAADTSSDTSLRQTLGKRIGR